MRTVLEHCIYRNANDTRRCEVTMTGDSGGCYVKSVYMNLMDLTGKMVDASFECVCDAWWYLDKQFKEMRDEGYSYTALSLEEVA